MADFDWLRKFRKYNKEGVNISEGGLHSFTSSAD